MMVGYGYLHICYETMKVNDEPSDRGTVRPSVRSTSPRFSRQEIHAEAAVLGTVNGYEFGPHLCPGIAEGRTAGQEDLVELFPQHANLFRGEYARPLALLGELASKLTRLHSALHTIHINLMLIIIKFDIWYNLYVSTASDGMIVSLHDRPPRVFNCHVMGVPTTKCGYSMGIFHRDIYSIN